MIKYLSPAQRHLTNRPDLATFHRYWAESHGPLYTNNSDLRRYVQHLTLPEAFGHDPSPTFDGVSMFWFDEYVPLGAGKTDRANEVLHEEVSADDAQLFDRTVSWPTHLKRASVVATEHVVVDGPTTPDMVKAIFIAARLPGLTLKEFFEHWGTVHASLGSAVPGLRRYVQNHGLPAAYAAGVQTHDGWSELWFDDLASLHAAVGSPAWQALREDGATLFAQPMGVVVARERIQKDRDWTYNDWGVSGLDEAAIRRRLRDQGYSRLADDPDAPARIKAAAEHHALAVWTDEHLVSIDDPRISERPDGRGRS